MDVLLGMVNEDILKLKVATDATARIRHETMTASLTPESDATSMQSRAVLGSLGETSLKDGLAELATVASERERELDRPDQLRPFQTAETAGSTGESTGLPERPT